jgi:hypothetical protein
MNQIADLKEWIQNLPVPGVDEKPPEVTLSAQDMIKVKNKRKLLRVGRDTERAVKYILCDSPLFGADLKKDGDWLTVAGGHKVFQKKTADYQGGIMLPDTLIRSSLFVEVKGVSPGYHFQLSRLDRPNKEGSKSQHEKLTEKWEEGDLVWLAIGWWLRKDPSVEKVNGKWNRDDLDLEVSLVDWGDWLDVLQTLKYRHIKHRDSNALGGKIYKKGNVWALSENHWWKQSEYQMEV